MSKTKQELAREAIKKGKTLGQFLRELPKMWAMDKGELQAWSNLRGSQRTKPKRRKTMTVVYQITPKGKDHMGSCGGHANRILAALNRSKKGLSTADLIKVVAKESSSKSPFTISEWYCTQLHNLGCVKRTVE